MRRRPWNRTAPETEEAIVRLRVEHPNLGAASLRFLARRVLGVHLGRETVRRIIARRRDLLGLLEDQRRKRPRRISIKRRRRLWGADLTLVWTLGFIPVWIFAAVDYHGSRLVAVDVLPWPSTVAITNLLERTFVEHGAPRRLLTDRGSVFTANRFAAFLEQHHVRHVRTRPAHPWTNGRIERVFRTFKELAFGHVWLFTSRRQLIRFATDFRTFYNRDRPHAAYGGRTPDEVYFDRPPAPTMGRVSYFDGRLSWYRFGH